MTQEVQPLAWQKRTNLEEHQQFFSKINEIIANLAPTVNEAEAAIAQATQAIASANAAINTANAASANADAASQQAQTAATTVAGYDARLTTAEGDIDALDTRMSAAESKNTQQDASIATLQTADGQNVKISGNQDITGIKTVPTEATGNRSQQIANSTKVGAELDNYSFMLRTTGNQTKTGVLTISRSGWSAEADALRFKMNNLDWTVGSGQSGRCELYLVDKNDEPTALLGFRPLSNGHMTLVFSVRKTDGSWVDTVISDVNRG